MLGSRSLFPKEISAILPPLEYLVRRYLPGSNMDDQARDRRRELEDKKEMDAHKGLTYFDNFNEIAKWKPEGVDPIQRASVPLLVRDHGSCATNAVDPKLLVVHDYSGGYLDYEATGMTGVMEEDFTMDHLQSVETFVYYSKHLVTTPPPTWTNLLHKNGVKCLGTLYIDRQTPGLDALFNFVTYEEESKKRSYVVAEKLAKMARIYGFDGWLVSISTGFPSDTWDTDMMVEFLSELRVSVYEQWKPEYTTKIGSVTQIIW
jgi:endo-beta-N-acetylglucosaminidase D